MAAGHFTFADASVQAPALGNCGDLGRILALTDDERLLVRLRAYNHTGRPPYSAAAMWRAFITKYVLGLRYNIELVRLLRADPQIRLLCGFGDAVPNASVICRFFQRLTCHSDLVESRPFSVWRPDLRATLRRSRRRGAAGGTERSQRFH